MRDIEQDFLQGAAPQCLEPLSYCRDVAEIPRVIWINWFQGWDQAPELVKACKASWERRNPGWDVVALSNDSIASYVDIADAVPNSRGKWFTPEAHSDLLRVALLARYGGVWADATTWCARSLDEWLPSHAPSGWFAFERPGPDRMLASWFLVSDSDALVPRSWQRACDSYWEGRSSSDDYFWFHHLFESCYNTDPIVHATWDLTRRLPAGPPHSLQERLHEEVQPHDIEALNGAGSPVLKLTHKSKPEIVSGTVHEAIRGFWGDSEREGPRRILLLWYGSIPGNGTVGDVLALEAAAGALVAEGYHVDCATWYPVRGVRTIATDAWIATDYALVVFVCGPIMGEHAALRALLAPIPRELLLGISVSLFDEDHRNHWDPFVEVLAREGGGQKFDDVAVLAPTPAVNSRAAIPSNTLRLGLVLRGMQDEYAPARCLADRVEELVADLVARLGCEYQVESVMIEHHLERSGLTADEIESQYEACDLILTTRFHGAVLATRHGVPFVAIDQIEGGGKVSRLLGDYAWPYVLKVDDLEPDDLEFAARAALASSTGLRDALLTQMRGGANQTIEALIDAVRRRAPAVHPS